MYLLFLHLLFLLGLRPSPLVLSHYPISRCRNLVIPTQIYFLIHLGGDGRNRTAVQHALLYNFALRLQQFFNYLLRALRTARIALAL